MVDPVTPNRNLSVPVHGTDVDTWDVPMNANFGSLDTITGAITSIGAVGGVSTTLNAAQLACGTISVTGAIASNAGLIFPAVQGWWSVENLTTGAGVLFVRAGIGTEIICMPPGEITDIQINGNVARYRALGRIGSYLDYAGASVPSWVSQCSVPPYLNCDGSAFSAVTYPVLNTILGGTTLPDIRGTAKYTLNQGTSRVTSAGCGIDGNTRLTIGGDQRQQAHTHAVIGSTGDDAPDHTHSINGGANFTIGSTSVGNGNAAPGAAGPATLISGVSSGASVRHIHPISFVSQTTGSGTFQNMPPITITGICMIRAG